MRDDFEQNEFPLAYLITFRTYGTWLHGDERTSIRRGHESQHGTKVIDINIPLKERMQEKTQEPVLLNRVQRKVVQDSIKEVCQHRNYNLYAANVRSNHAHSVIGAQAKPERIADTRKAYATLRLRELGLIGPQIQVWARGRSRKYLWKTRHVDAAIDYVLYCQGDMPFELDD
jgi:REP element-mobilizing transposase RayT